MASQSVKHRGLSCQIGPIDNTSFHVDGRYNSALDVSERAIHITQGVRLNHRPDLNQVVLQLIGEHQAGIPLWMEVLSGNSNDKESFRHTLNTHL